MARNYDNLGPTKMSLLITTNAGMVMKRGRNILGKNMKAM